MATPWSRWAAVAVAAIVCGTAGPGAAYASAPAERELPSAEQRDVAIDASVAGEFPASAGPETRMSVLVTVGAPLTDLADVSASLSVTDAPLESAEAIESFVKEPASTVSHAVAASPVTASSGATAPAPGTLKVGTSTTVALSAAPGSLGLPADAWGVYGVTVSVMVGQDMVWSAASPLTWQPTLVPPLDVTVVASISGPNERVASLLEAAGDERVALLVDPSALTIGQRLSLDRREAYILPAGNLDITSVAHAEAPALLDAALAESRRHSTLAWLAVAASADDATAALATNAGAVAVLADPRWSGEAGSASSVVTAVAVDELKLAPIILPDPDLSATLASQPPAQPATTARVLAVAALKAGSGDGSVVVAPGDGWVVDGTQQSRAVEMLLNAPFVTARPLTVALSAPNRPSLDLPDTTPSAADAGSNQAVGAISALDRLNVMATAADSPSAMVADARRAVFDAMSLADRADPERRAVEFADAADRANAVINTVAVTSGNTLNLVSSSGDVPVTVRNDLDVPVTVRVAMMSRSPVLVTKAQPTATIAAGSETTVLIPVSAVSNGDVDVTVALRNKEGQTVAVAQTLRVKVRAQWGNAATGVFTAGLVVLLIAGIVRTARRGRKDTRVRPTDSADVAGASDADA
ncbi:DUF6049 family protein [Demequina sp.]|uniref:DUF6049 family protein n=1 Tax=Demequina sp. TaxID=2050685 RepID=UPI0025C14D87|nr:DUF6049 family protein [Demequina sp.]